MPSRIAWFLLVNVDSYTFPNKISLLHSWINEQIILLTEIIIINSHIQIRQQFGLPSIKARHKKKSVQRLAGLF